MRFSLPTTTSRVSKCTDRKVNDRIRQRTIRNVERFCGTDRGVIERRLEELDREWDIERLIETGASANIILGLGLGAFVNRRWFAFSGAVAAFLMLHALHGWAPPMPILRRLGVRTQAEIEEERDALRILRGDFHATSDPRKALAQARLSCGPSIAGEDLNSRK